MTDYRVALLCLLLLSPLPVMAQGVPIRVLRSTVACRDLSDMIRLALHMAEGDKAGYMAFYEAQQATGACVPLREGTVALLQDSHDEQGLHLVCIKQAEDPVCYWSDSPKFGPSPS